MSINNEPSELVDLEKGVNGDQGEQYIHIGRSKVHVKDVLGAFGGTLNPGLAEPSRYQIANPTPLGLSALAVTLFVFSVVNARGQGVNVPNVVVGLAFFYGGAIQLFAGMWEFVNNNTFAATALSSYGGFWMSYAAVLTPSFGIVSAYKGDADMLGNALGFYLLGWTIFTIGLTCCTMKSTWALFIMFVLLSVDFLVLSIANFTGSEGCTKAAGIMGIIESVVIWYNAFAGLASKENSYIRGYPVYLPGGKPPKSD